MIYNELPYENIFGVDQNRKKMFKIKDSFFYFARHYVDLYF